MRRERWWPALMALVIAANWKSTLTLPVPDDELDTSPKLLGSSVVTSVSIVTGAADEIVAKTNTADRRRVIPSTDLPASPADLMRPDKFQFFTLNKEGNVVTKQMTEKEIQSLIAAGGGHLPMEIHEPQKVGDMPTGGMKVADVVQNVQNVLKSELSKPATVMTSVPTIPGHVNTQWSSILPAILGGDSEAGGPSESSSLPDSIETKTEIPISSDAAFVKVPDTAVIQSIAEVSPTKNPESSPLPDYESSKNPPGSVESQLSNEKPMIQVPVITIDEKLPEADSTPIFQMLNTISADKINERNNTNEKLPSSETTEKSEVEKPDSIPIRETINENAPVVNDDVPEMIEINYTPGNTEPSVVTHVVKPVNPQSDSSDSMTVVSETHSTSMKITGHEEIPLPEQSVPIVQNDVKPEEVQNSDQPTYSTEKSSVVNTVGSKLDSTTLPAERPTEQPEKTSTEQILEEVALIENLPQTASSLIPEIGSNEPNTTPAIEASVPPKIEQVQVGSTTESPKATSIPVNSSEPVTSEQPNDSEPIYQALPEIVPDEKIQVHATLASEVASIEHIIETLNDPVGLPNTIAIDRFPILKTPEIESNVSKTDNPENTGISEIKSSTSATPINKETLVESNSAQSMEPLPTELADSLSSMISQISDARPSVFPLGQSAGLDTAEKTNLLNVNAEENTDVDNATNILTQDIEPPKSLVDVVTLEEKPEMPVSTTEADQDITTIGYSTSTESDSTKTEITTQSSNDNSALKSDGPIASNDTLGTLEVTASKIDQPVTQKPEVPVSQTPKVEFLMDEVQASSEPIADQVISHSEVQESSTIDEAAIRSNATETPAVEKNITEIASVETSFPDPTTSTLLPESTQATIVPSTNNPTVGERRPELEDSKTERPIEVRFNESNTELPIVRLDILETVPTKDHATNASVASEDDSNGGAESPMVRIKLTDPVAQINSMIETSNVDARPPLLVSLSLPETGSVPSNIIASSLIAGFPSTADPTTTLADLSSQSNPTSAPPLKHEPEVLILNDSVPRNLTESKIPDAPISEVQVEIEKPVALGLQKDGDKPEKLGTSETSDTPTIAPEVQGPIETIPEKPSIVENTELPITRLDSSTETPKEHSKTEDSIIEITTSASIEAKVDTTQASTESIVSESQKTPEDPIKIVTLPEEPSTEISPPLVGELNQDDMKISVPLISINLDKKPVESSKVDEASTSSLKPNAEQLEETKETKQTNKTFDATDSSNLQTQDDPINFPDKISDDKSPETPTAVENVPEMISVQKKSENDERIQEVSTTEASRLETTTNSPVAAPENATEISTQSPAVNVNEKTETNLNDTKLDNAEEIEKSNSSSTSISSPQNPESSISPSTHQQTEEVRIRVNDTAVLVTKRPISDVPSKNHSDPTSPQESQPLEENQTTPKVISVTEKTLSKSEEKVVLPVPADNSSNADVGLEKVVKKGIDEVTKKVENVDEAEKNKPDEILVKTNDTRKAIKKNSESNSLPIEDKVVPLDINPPSKLNDNPLAIQEKNSDAQLSTKVQITMAVDQPSNTTSSIDAVKLQENPTDSLKNSSISISSSEKPLSTPESPVPKPDPKKDDSKPTESKWALIPQTAYPGPTKVIETLGKRPTTTEIPSTVITKEPERTTTKTTTKRPAISLDHPQSASGLDSTVKNLEPDVSYFVNLCNELAFSFWTATNKGLSTARSLAVSPFGMTSMLAMVFLGARGPTSDQMNDVLKLDDVASFNPHLVFQNVTDTVSLARNQGIANAAFVRELFADRSKVRKLMPFYKEKAQKFYDGVVAEVNFATISDLVRRRTNLMIRKQTGGRIKDFVRTNTVPLRSPLAALSANVFQTNCNSSAASSEGRDGELYFAVSPAVRQRKLVPVPATVWRAGFLAGYEPNLDATAMALGGIDNLVSTIFVIPGQQSLTAPGDNLERLEKRLVDTAIRDSSWNKLLKVLIPRPGSELQVPKFSHRSVINATAALKRMGLEELFSKHANLKGINGVATDLHLADVLQMNLFSTCGDENIISGRHHVEVYPGSPLRNARDYDAPEESIEDGLADYPMGADDGLRGLSMPYPLERKVRSARQNEATEKLRLKLDRPFLYFVRHNPTGLILHMGRFNPRLLP